jgi:hypothetical protein
VNETAAGARDFKLYWTGLTINALRPRVAVLVAAVWIVRSPVFALREVPDLSEQDGIAA